MFNYMQKQKIQIYVLFIAKYVVQGISLAYQKSYGNNSLQSNVSRLRVHLFSVTFLLKGTSQPMCYNMVKDSQIKEKKSRRKST